ncbi:MAG: hypothetical protein AB8F26_07655 [Phycisphaerales bacterium]
MSGSENLITTIGDVGDDQDVRARLGKLSKSGKLAGFEPGLGDRIASFTAYGAPFDGCVDVVRSDVGLEFVLRMPRKLPALFAAALIVSVWPGLPLTEAFLQGFGWYERLTSGWFQTWMWYLPLAVIPAPFALMKAISNSRKTALAHANETIDRLRPKLVTTSD